MSPAQMVLIAVAVIIVVALCLFAWSWFNSRSLKERGSEYERAVVESEGRLAADRELRDRQRRQATLEFSQLSPQARAGYSLRWQQVQAKLLTAPHEAVNEADNLLTQLIAELGNVPSAYYEHLAPLSADHANALRLYREAHQISMSNRRGEAAPRQLRVAVGHFQVLVAGLLGEVPAAHVPDDPQPHPVWLRG